MKTNVEYMKFVPARVQAKAKLPPTSADIEGPFYKAGAPLRTDGVLCGFQTPNLVIHGQVVDEDGEAVSGVLLDVWQADASGAYDNDGFDLRGRLPLLNNGRYLIKTIMPGNYKISDPGQPDDFRCAHLHVRVTAPWFETLTTQLYFGDDPYDATDHWFDKSRVITHPIGLFQFVLKAAH